MELEIIMLSEVNQVQKDESHVFPQMWKLDLKDKFTCKYICDLYLCMYVYLSIYLPIYDYNRGSVSGDYREGRRGKENDRVNNYESHSICMKLLYQNSLKAVE
jgi:hypothetical protein